MPAEAVIGGVDDNTGGKVNIVLIARGEVLNVSATALAVNLTFMSDASQMPLFHVDHMKPVTKRLHVHNRLIQLTSACVKSW